MREIKFRAWDTVAEQMLPVEIINFRQDLITLDEGENSVSDTAEMFILMQYTGLKDKNGVEIYEGDIFPVDLYRKIHEVRIVCYDSKQGKYKAVPLSLYHANAGSGGWTGFDINSGSEVIGNIYDHKHLLNLPGESEEQ